MEEQITFEYPEDERSTRRVCEDEAYRDEEGGSGDTEEEQFPTFSRAFEYDDEFLNDERLAPPRMRPRQDAGTYVPKTSKRGFGSKLACMAAVVLVGFVSGIALPARRDANGENADPQRDRGGPLPSPPLPSAAGNLHALEARPRAVTGEVAGPAADGADPDGDALRIEAGALATIKSSSPRSTDGGAKFISVASDPAGDRVSFLRFDLSSLSGRGDVAGATLELFLASKHARAGAVVSVDVLPRGGDWPEGSVSWARPVEGGGSEPAGSFAVAGPDGGRAVRVDVTRAIDPAGGDVTFRLSTDSRERLDFASRGFRGGEAAPELVVTLES